MSEINFEEELKKLQIQFIQLKSTIKQLQTEFEYTKGITEDLCGFIDYNPFQPFDDLYSNIEQYRDEVELLWNQLLEIQNNPKDLNQSF